MKLSDYLANHSTVEEGSMTTKHPTGEKPFTPSMDAPKKKYPAIGTLAWEKLPKNKQAELLAARGHTKVKVKEAFGGFSKLSSGNDSPVEDDIDLSGEPDEVDLDPEKPESTTDEVDLDPDKEEGDGEADIVGDIEDKASEDPNRQGLIRTVPNAHLIYKREKEDGTFEELWIYNIGNIKTDMETKKAILSGTDIPPNKTRSGDGEQEATVWSVGNAELVSIKGLPN
jgi:hypothetical protein